jgi:hypothetical protein
MVGMGRATTPWETVFELTFTLVLGRAVVVVVNLNPVVMIVPTCGVSP